MLARAGPVQQWAERYGLRIDSWQLPSSTVKRAARALDGSNAWAVYDPHAPAWPRELPAVHVLRMVWLQNDTRTVPENGQGVRRRMDLGQRPRLRHAVGFGV
jgi:hypothetical protein